MSGKLRVSDRTIDKIKASMSGTTRKENARENAREWDLEDGGEFKTSEVSKWNERRSSR